MKPKLIPPEVGFQVTTPKGDGTVTEKASGWFTVDIDGEAFKFRVKDLKCYAQGETLDGAEDLPDTDNKGEDDGNTRIKADLEKYDTVKAASGNRSYDTGDVVAKMLRGLDLDQVYKIAAKELKDAGETITIKAMKERYANLNPGHQRMCVGNRIRAARARALSADDEGATDKK